MCVDFPRPCTEHSEAGILTEISISAPLSCGLYLAKYTAVAESVLPPRFGRESRCRGRRCRRCCRALSESPPYRAITDITFQVSFVNKYVRAEPVSHTSQRCTRRSIRRTPTDTTRHRLRASTYEPDKKILILEAPS